MADTKRIEFHNILKTIMGGNNAHVYYRPPENSKIEYPCIIYNRANIEQQYASNISYFRKRCYRVTLCDKAADSQYIDALLDIPTCRYLNHTEAEGISNDTFEIYY